MPCVSAARTELSDQPSPDGALTPARDRLHHNPLTAPAQRNRGDWRQQAASMPWLAPPLTGFAWMEKNSYLL